MTLNDSDILARAQSFASAYNKVHSQISQVIVGHSDIIDSVLVCLFTGGHALLEGVPGLGKTLLIRSLSQALSLKFSRIQFTPDLMPADITGTTIVVESRRDDGATSREFQFQHGPVFAQIVLADEINRATPKTQSAMLEAMQERSVTVGGTTYPMTRPFFVMATQNPIEQEGTYPLPEAQMDRFIMKINVDYPDDAAEEGIIRLVRGEESGDAPDEPRLSQEIVFAARRALGAIQVSPNIDRYVVALVMATRDPQRYEDSRLKDWIRVGSSPRASIALDKCARAAAWLAGRDYVTPEDVRSIAHGVLRHRLILSYDALAEDVGADKVIDEILQQVAAA